MLMLAATLSIGSGGLRREERGAEQARLLRGHEREVDRARRLLRRLRERLRDLEHAGAARGVVVGAVEDAIGVLGLSPGCGVADAEVIPVRRVDHAPPTDWCP